MALAPIFARFQQVNDDFAYGRNLGRSIDQGTSGLSGQDRSRAQHATGVMAQQSAQVFNPTDLALASDKRFAGSVHTEAADLKSALRDHHVTDKEWTRIRHDLNATNAAVAAFRKHP